MSKKSSLLITVFLILTVSTSYGNTYQVGTISEFTNAIAAREADNEHNEYTIQLTKDLSTSVSSSHIVFNSSTHACTLDLAGHSITGVFDGTISKKSEGFINIQGGSLTITDSSSSGTGKIINTNSMADAAVIGIFSNATVTIQAGKITGTNKNAIYVNEGALNITGGYIYGKEYDIVSTNNATINITGGYFSKTVKAAPGYYRTDNVDQSYPFKVIPCSLTYYAGKSIEDNGTTATWKTIQGKTHNAIAVVDEDNEDWAATQTNVLVEHTAADNSKSYSCSNFVLTDLADFYSPYDFTAASATYTRSAEKMHYYNTFCLPFAITPSDVNGKIYIFKEYDSSADTEGIIMQEQTDGIEAGVPCIIQSDSADPSTGTSTGPLTITKNGITISKEINNSEHLKGRFTFGSIGAEYYKLIYGTKDSAFGKTSSSGTCSQFRSYLDLTNFSSAKESINISWGDGNLTPIEEVFNKEVTNGGFFNLSGQKVTDCKNAIIITRAKNGKVIKYLKK